MFSFKNRREQVNLQGVAQRVPRHTITVGEVRVSTRHCILIAQQVIGGKP
jgi:hypothetical protein